MVRLALIRVFKEVNELQMVTCQDPLMFGPGHFTCLGLRSKRVEDALPMNDITNIKNKNDVVIYTSFLQFCFKTLQHRVEIQLHFYKNESVKSAKL